MHESVRVAYAHREAGSQWDRARTRSLAMQIQSKLLRINQFSFKEIITGSWTIPFDIIKFTQIIYLVNIAFY